MSGYFRVTTRQATEAEQETEAQRIRNEELAELRQRLAELDRPLWVTACGPTGCCSVVVLVFGAIVLLATGLWRRPEAVLIVLALCIAVQAHLAADWRRDERRRLTYLVTSLEQLVDSGEPILEYHTIESRIVGALHLWEYRLDDPDKLLLDLGDGRLLLLHAAEDYFWHTFFWRTAEGQAPLHREFRLTIRHRADPLRLDLLSYEPMGDEEAVCEHMHWSELPPQAQKDLPDALEGLATAWDIGSPAAEFDGSLDTWIEDVIRAYSLTPRSNSRAEADPDADRGLSRPD